MPRRISSRSCREIRKHLRQDARRFSIFVRSFFLFWWPQFFVWAVHNFILQCSERSGSSEHRVDEQWNYQVQHRLGPLSWPYWTLWFWFQFPISTAEFESLIEVKEHKMTSTAKKWWQREQQQRRSRGNRFFSFKRATSKDTRESALWSNWITFFPSFFCIRYWTTLAIVMSTIIQIEMWSYTEKWFWLNWTEKEKSTLKLPLKGWMNNWKFQTIHLWAKKKKNHQIQIIS